MKFVKLAALGAALLAAQALAVPAMAADPVVLKFGADTPSSGSLWVKSLKPWADKVQAESNGALKFEFYPDGQINKQAETIDRVTSGVVDVVWDLPLVYGQRFQSMTLLGVPGLYSNAPDAAAALWRLYEKGIVGKEYADVKMIAFLVNPNVNVFTKAPLKDNGNLDGLKISVGSKLRGQITQGVGGVPVSLRVPELYQALSKGVVDGSMTNVAVIQAMRLDEQLHYYVDGPFGGAVATIVMSKKVYDSLPPEARKAIDANSGEAASRRYSQIAVEDEAAIMAGLLKDAKNKQVRLEGEALAKWQKAFEPVVAEWVTSTPNGQAMVDAFKAEMAKK